MENPLETKTPYIPSTSTMGFFRTFEQMRRLLIPMIFIYGGGILIFAQYSKIPILEFITQKPLFIAGTGLMIVGVAIFPKALFSRVRHHEESFISVDRHAELKDIPLGSILRELHEIKNTKSDIDYAKLKAIVEDAQSSKLVTPPESFRAYFANIKEVLESKSAIADQKASILLDKGTAYSKAGIWFFIISIIAWQALSWSKGFQPQFLYGIISCAALFVFMQFLSAWFLRQYRHFVDTSTYLIKIKAIFDKYMLSYFVLSEDSFKGENLARGTELIAMLKTDIPWPDPELYKRGDVNFAKETLENLAFFAKAVRDESKGK